MLLRSASRLAGALPAMPQPQASASVSSGLLRQSAPRRGAAEVGEYTGPGRGDNRWQYLKYSVPGAYSTYSQRQRYFILVQKAADPLITDFFCAKAIRGWNSDLTFFGLQWLFVVTFACMNCHMMRLAMFNPDVHVRRSSVRRNACDCVHYWGYGLPYYNHRLRNTVTSWGWTLYDNEGQWNYESGTGCRPDREDSPRKWLVWNYQMSVTQRHPEWNWMHSTTSHENMERMYHNEGYKKQPHKFHAHDEEED